MDCGSAAAQFRVMHGDSCRAGRGAPEESQVEGYGVGLILG